MSEAPWKRNGSLAHQLREKDQQISELHQFMAMKEKNLATFGEQLEHAQWELEDMRSIDSKAIGCALEPSVITG